MLLEAREEDFFFFFFVRERLSRLKSFIFFLVCVPIDARIIRSSPVFLRASDYFSHFSLRSSIELSHLYPLRRRLRTRARDRDSKSVGPVDFDLRRLFFSFFVSDLHTAEEKNSPCLSLSPPVSDSETTVPQRLAIQPQKPRKNNNKKNGRGQKGGDAPDQAPLLGRHRLVLRQAEKPEDAPRQARLCEVRPEGEAARAVHGDQAEIAISGLVGKRREKRRRRASFSFFRSPPPPPQFSRRSFQGPKNKKNATFVKIQLRKQCSKS